jgi:hypothetical protein
MGMFERTDAALQKLERAGVNDKMYMGFHFEVRALRDLVPEHAAQNEMIAQQRVSVL